jgi:hypothetical protein
MDHVPAGTLLGISCSGARSAPERGGREGELFTRTQHRAGQLSEAEIPLRGTPLRCAP